MVKRLREEENHSPNAKTAKFMTKRGVVMDQRNKTDLANFFALQAAPLGLPVNQLEIPWYLSAAVKYFPETLDNQVENHVVRNRNLWYLASCFRRHINLEESIEMFPSGLSKLAFTVYKIIEVNGQYLFDEVEGLENGLDITKIYYEYDSAMSLDDALRMAYKTHEYFKKVRRVPNWPANVNSGDFKNSVVKYELVEFKFHSENREIQMPSTPLIAPFPHVFFKAFLSPVDNEEDSMVRLDIYFDLSKFNRVSRTDGLFRALAKIFKSHLEKQLEIGQLGNTLDFLPFTPPGFDSRLYDYQKRSLKWMLEVENKANKKERQVTHLQTSHLAQFDAVPDTFVNFLNTSTISRSSNYYDSVDYTCNGGVLADNPGYGKTVTTLSLIHSNPLSSFSSLNMTALQKFAMFPSKATLIICPNNLVEQWRLEVLEWLPSDIQCLTISKMKDLHDITWLDVVLADIVIVEIGFLQNTAYTKMLHEIYGKLPHGQSGGFYFAETMRDVISNREERALERGKVNLEAFYYHRVVFDEFHEIDQYQNGVKEIAKNFKSDWLWGMTGTPRFKTVADIELSAKYLQVDLQNSSAAGCLSFKDRFIRRNNEDIALPPVYDQIEWITLTPGEMGLYDMAVAGKGGPRSVVAFAACSHYQINDDVVEAAGHQVLSTEEVADLLHGRLTVAIETLSHSIRISQRAIREIKENLRDDDHYNAGTRKGKRDVADRERQALRAEYEMEKRNLNTQKLQLQAKTEELAAFDQVRERLATVQECRVCNIPMENAEDVSLTPCCSRFLHPDCLTDYLTEEVVCPICEKDIDPQKIQVIKRNGQQGGNDVEKCGTKITAMLKRLESLKTENPNVKVIVFSQFKRLANLIFKAFQNAGVETSCNVFIDVDCHGSTQTRTKAISDFKSRNTTAILLSTEDSVSGLHLPEATHIFIAHPFWFGDKPLELERAISAEKQGIARAHRLGLQHPLNVIRFYTRNTLEEEVVKDRKIALPDAAQIIAAEERQARDAVVVEDSDEEPSDNAVSDVYQQSLNLDEMSENGEDDLDELADF